MQKYPEETDQEDSRAALARSREREAATREILDVISQSRDDERPVFDTILKQAEKLCGADGSGLQLLNPDGTHLRIVAIGSWDEKGSFPVGTEFDLDDPLGMCIAVQEKRVVHFEDLKETELYKQGHEGRRKLVDVEGVLTHLHVPLIQDGKAFGNITLSRRVQRPFSPDDIALVETFAAQAVIAIENVRQFRELQSRLEQETVSGQVLELISTSRDDDLPVFERILQSVSRLCHAPLAYICILDRARGRVTIPAQTGARPSFAERLARFDEPVEKDFLMAVRATLERKVIRIADLADDDLYRSGNEYRVNMVDEEGMRSVLTVPLFKGAEGVGSIVLYRREVLPFSDAEVAVVRSFAAQAVIAIDNVRQFRELQERLRREAATRKILSVISQSRDDEQPVFDLIVSLAKALCNAHFSGLVLGQSGDEYTRLVAHDNLHPDIRQLWTDKRYPLESGTSLVADAILDAQVQVIEDMGETKFHREGDDRYRIVVVDHSIRSNLLVPLISNGEGIGCLMLGRKEVSPYSDDEIALIQSFAAQAVIAIENVRQFREVRTRLEREKASREILQVISASRTDPAPVFDMILENAAQLSGAPLANLCILNEARSHWNLVAHFGDGLRHLTVGRTASLQESELVPAVAIRTARVIHIEDLTETDLYKAGDPGRVAMVEEEGMRTILGVPLLIGDVAIGCITLFRREVKAFTEDEITLAETFAAQAVIAIENVRQFREVQERLEREAATREVLQVISQSRDDEQPVFEKILQNAARLCHAPDAALMLLTPSGTHFRIRAHWGNGRINLTSNRKWHVDDPLPIAQCFREARTVHIGDMQKSAPYLAGNSTYLQMVDEDGLRTRLCVPLLKDGAAFGVIALSRYEVAPFDDGEIELIETFAAQAVIAIENVRQFKALEDSNADMRDVLERQTATARVLDVISQSPSDVQPVFDVIAETAMRLCDADAVVIWQIGPDGFELGAALPDTPDRLRMLKEHPATMDEGSVAGRAFATRATVHIDDISADPVLSQLPIAQKTQARTMLAVPLFSPQQEPVGLIGLPRREVRSFSPEEVALVETFADQASIAIENVRLFKALEKLNDELGDRVEAQVGEIERMGKLKRFLPAAVADTVVTSGSEDMLKSHRALLGVLFCDIRGFTAFCETAEPEETIEVLQTYHEEMGKLINVHGAGVDLRMGDGIMVLFNDPIPCDDPAGDAVRLAIAMRTRMAALCKSWKRLGHKLGFGVGISLGYATIGLVGSEGRFDYTASGTAVNLAARLCDEAEDGEILLSPRAGIAVEDDFTVQSRGEISLKGIREPLEVFMLAGPASA